MQSVFGDLATFSSPVCHLKLTKISEASNPNFEKKNYQPQNSVELSNFCMIDLT